MKRLILSLTILCALQAWSQSDKSAAFNHLDLSLTTGTTGIGFDVSMPVNNFLDLRTGFAFMPHITQKMHFGVEIGDDPNLSRSRIERLTSLLQEVIGNNIDDQITMDAMPTYWNWKVLADVKPFKNKHWHFTAGFFLGNKQIGKAVNSMEDMSTLMALTIYNKMYDNVSHGRPIVSAGSYTFDEEEVRRKLMEYGQMGISMGRYKHDVYYEEDEICTQDYWDAVNDVFYFEGDIIHHKGDVKHARGDRYRMVPDENSMVSARAFANSFKPYLGFGYGGRLIKGDDSWHVSFDAGALFWGGTPSVKTHDGTDLMNDVENVHGKVGDYIDIMKSFKVFPVLNLRITKRLF